MNVDQMSTDESRPESFHHQRLDHGKPSIRLIKILPELNSDGVVRCEVSNTTTGSQVLYRCLSYRWGEPDAATSREIELNGAPFEVRKNLYDFLHMLRSNIGYSTILGSWAGGVWWIDAMCIDQRNTLERNHQVAQMGNIYSEAEEVVVWLGLASLAKNRIRSLLDLAPSRNSPRGVESDGQNRVSLHDRRNIGRRIVRNEYWNRAWITQEIALAQSVSILVDDLLYGFSELVDLLSLLEIPWRQSHMNQCVGIRNGTIDLSTPGLIDLLDHFQDRICTLPQDRVFSLISLCSDVGGFISVDYNMSKDKLTYQTMMSASHTNEGQRRGCSCSPTIVARSLGMHMQSGTPVRMTTGTYLEFEVDDILDESVELHMAGKRQTPSVCQSLGLAYVGNALEENVKPDGYWHLAASKRERRRILFPSIKSYIPPVMKSYIRGSYHTGTVTTSRKLEIAPGCSIEVLDGKGQTCRVRIAFWALPTFFYDVTRLCEDPNYTLHEDFGIMRRVRVVYEPPKSGV